MIKTVFSKKSFLVLTFLAIVNGIFLAGSQLGMVPYVGIDSLEEVFAFVRDSQILFRTGEEYKDYGIFVFECLINIFIFIPLIAQYFTDDFEVAKSFVFVRLKDVSKWYRYKILSNFVYAFYAAFSFNGVLLLFSFFAGYRAESLRALFQIFVFGIFTHFIIVFIITMLANIISIKTKPYVGGIVAICFTVISIGFIVFSTPQQAEFQLLTYYFPTWHTYLNSSNMEFTFLPFVYYAILMIIALSEIALGKKVLQTTDHI